MCRAGCASEDRGELCTVGESWKRAGVGTADLGHHNQPVAGTERLVARAGYHARSHGIHGHLLEASVGGAGGTVRFDAGQCGAYQTGAWPQDGSKGRGVDRRLTAARTAEEKL